MAKLTFDPLKDFVPISLVAAALFMLLTHPALPVKSVKDLIALAKERARGRPRPECGRRQETLYRSRHRSDR